MKKILPVILLFILGCHQKQNDPQFVIVDNTPEKLYAFVGSVLNINAGLVSSRPGECFTTVYKNSLAIMVFLHEKNTATAERILNVFATYYQNAAPNFQGFPQNWDACTGLPTNANYWEGDNAFLLLALNYYEDVTGDRNRFAELRNGLVQWLGARADVCSSIVAEGVANMAAALKPHAAGNPLVQQQVDKLTTCFTAGVDFANVLDHTVRGALVFCNTSGFQYASNFSATDTWAVDGTTHVMAYRAFQGESFINVEISAQLLLAAKLFPSNFPANDEALEKELKKVALYTDPDSMVMGLPYYVIVPPGVDWNPASLPIIDPSCYLLFYYWGFNPFAPEEKCGQ